MTKLKMHSADLTQENVARIRLLFPGCVTEVAGGDGDVTLAVDFDRLRQELSGAIVEGPLERYQLTWPGKREALLAANAPIARTLRPCRDDSVDFDATRNLFIEGDNLEVLKLLQEAYLGQVKLIYIDPPYNSGGDFVYEDDFAERADEYLIRSKQRDASGGRLVSNSESKGRIHSNWLSMIYPRLKLARNLLADDGVIFASIDDNESANLRHVMDEVFGGSNFIDTIAVEMSTTSGPKTVNAQQGTIVKNVEFVHVYRKSPAFDDVAHRPLFDGIDAFDTHYTAWMNDDGTLGSLAERMAADERVGADIRRYGLMERGTFGIKSIDRLLALSEPARVFVDSNLHRIARFDRAPVSAAGRSVPVGRWETFETAHRTYFLTTIGSGSLQALMPLELNYRDSDDYRPRFGRTVIRGDLWKGFHQDMGNVAREGDMKFDNGKKPLRLIRQLIRWANNSRDGIVLDFFAGSGTTAHAVMQANAEDGGNRRFILVQLDEVPDPKSDAAKEGYRTIAALSRERLRRAGRTIATAGTPGNRVDVGFRSLRVDSSNMIEVHYSPDAFDHGNLDLFADNIKADRTAEDLLFQVMLDWGVDLASPLETRTVGGLEVHAVDGTALVACFDRLGGVDEAFVKDMATLKPARAVFRDAGFKDSAAKMNVEQIFKLLSPATDVKCV